MPKLKEGAEEYTGPLPGMLIVRGELRRLVEVMGDNSSMPGLSCCSGV